MGYVHHFERRPININREKFETLRNSIGNKVKVVHVWHERDNIIRKTTYFEYYEFKAIGYEFKEINERNYVVVLKLVKPAEDVFQKMTDSIEVWLSTISAIDDVWWIGRKACAVRWDKTTGYNKVKRRYRYGYGIEGTIISFDDDAGKFMLKGDRVLFNSISKFNAGIGSDYFLREQIEFLEP